MDSIYELTFNTPSGGEIALEDYKGRVLLLVNTATKCGLAGQFTELQALHEKYKVRGLAVIGFPCDQFMGQEPESDESIVGVCQVNFGVTFQLSAKIDVNGAHTHPVFDYVKHHSKSTLGSEIKWNFTKFLVSRDGETIKRYAPTTDPFSMEDDIVAFLA